MRVAGAFVLGLAMAMILDVAGVSALGAHRVATVLGATVGGAGVAALWPALFKRQTSRVLVIGGALLAAVTTFVLVHCQLGWLDLGPIGAGTPTQMPLVVAPLVSVLVTLTTWRR